MNRRQEIKILEAYARVDTTIGLPRAMFGIVLATASRNPAIDALGILCFLTGAASPAIVDLAQGRIQKLRAEQAKRPRENTKGIPSEDAPARRRRILRD